MKKLLSIILVFAALYYLKVPVVVTFIDQLLVLLIPLWDVLIDNWIHLMERHIFIYMSLPVLLFYLMLSRDHAEL